MVNINIQKKDLWLLSAIMVFLVGVAVVIAYGSGTPTVHGHDAGEVEFEFPNSYTRTCSTDGCTVSCDAGDVRTGCSLQTSGGGAFNNDLDYAYPSGTNSCTCEIYINLGTCYAICLDTA